MAKTLIDVDEELLTAAQAELGTATKKDTVNEALRYAAQRRSRVRQALSGDRLIGWGEDVGDPTVMKDARR